MYPQQFVSVPLETLVQGHIMRRESPLLRQWILLRTLCSRRYGISAQELVAQTSVSLKTIRRDIKVFEDAGFPIEAVTLEFGKKAWRIKSGWDNQPAVKFTFDEAMALYLGRQFLEPLRGTYFFESAQHAFSKLRACLGDEPVRHIETMSARMHWVERGNSCYERKAEIIDSIAVAIEDGKQTIIEYRSLRATEPVSYEVDPYTLVFHAGALYLVAFSRDHGEFRTFKIDRISGVEVSNLPFERDAEFVTSALFTNSFGIYEGKRPVTVRLLFCSTSARRIREGNWHTSQKIEDQPEGSVILSLNVSLSPELASNGEPTSRYSSRRTFAAASAKLFKGF